MFKRRRQKSEAEEFLEWLNGRAQGEPSFEFFDEENCGVPVTAIWYENFPERGSLFGCTYGVSLSAASGAPCEILIAVDSPNPAWPWAVAATGDQLRHQDTMFTPGETIDYGEPISPESGMSGFVLCEPFVLPDGDTGVVHVSDRQIVLVQAVPIFEEEVMAIGAIEDDAERHAVVGGFVAELGPAVFDIRRRTRPDLGVH